MNFTQMGTEVPWRARGCRMAGPSEVDGLMCVLGTMRIHEDLSAMCASTPAAIRLFAALVLVFTVTGASGSYKSAQVSTRRRRRWRWGVCPE